MFRYGVQCALQDLPESMPAIFRGSIREVMEESRKAGYEAIELYICNPKDCDVKEFKKVANDNGMQYAGICTGLEKIFNQLCLTDEDGSVRAKAIDRLKEHLDLGVELSCPVVVGTMRGNISCWEERQVYLDRLTEAMVQLDAYARQIEGELLIENIHQYVSNYLNTIDEVGSFIRNMGLPSVKLHIDTHSMHMEERSNPYDMVRKYADILGYVHFSDSNRGYPGSGMIDFKAYVHALMDADYKGYIVAEYQPFPTPMESAVLGLEYMKIMERAAQIERMEIKR